MRDIALCNHSASGHMKKQILLVGQFSSQSDGKEIRTSLHKKACCIDGMWMFVSDSTDALTCSSSPIFALNIHLGMNRKMFQDSSSALHCIWVKWSVHEHHKVIVLCNSSGSGHMTESYWMANFLHSALEQKLKHLYLKKWCQIDGMWMSVSQHINTCSF